MKTYGGMDVYMHVFLTSVLVEGEWSTLPLSRIGGWVVPKAGLDDVQERKFLTL
jgi:hypothetical protein